jgi:hypothetical protein
VLLPGPFISVNLSAGEPIPDLPDEAILNVVLTWNIGLPRFLNGQGYVKDTFASLSTLDRIQELTIEGKSISQLMSVLELLEKQHELPNKLPRGWSQMPEYETPPPPQYLMPPRKESSILGGWDSM